MKDKLIKVHLHSRRLIPAHIVDLARANGDDLSNISMSDTIMTWIEREQQTHRFQPNDSVYDIENIELKMNVVQILKKVERIKNGEVEKVIRRIKGIECEYWS